MVTNLFKKIFGSRNERLIKLINGVGEMKVGNFKDSTIDAFGDAY